MTSLFLLVGVLRARFRRVQPVLALVDSAFVYKVGKRFY